MADSDYPSKIVLIGYFVQEQDAGTPDKRARFSQEIFDFYDAHVVRACAAATPPIDPSPEARAIMAVMALHGTGNRRQQALQAVAAYFAHRGR